MNRRQRRIAHGGLSGAVAFVAGWAVVSYVTRFDAIPALGRWETTIWVWLGANFVDTPQYTQIGLISNYVNPARVAGVPRWVHGIPIIAVGAAAYYTATQHATHNLKYAIRNGLNAGLGYLTLGLLAMILTDINPGLTTILTIAFFVLAGIWLGSTVLNVFTGGLPFFGIVSLGTVVMLGVFVIIGGIAVLNATYGLLAVSLLPAAGGGLLVGASEHLAAKSGRRGSRLDGLVYVLRENWKPILLFVMLALALYIGVSGAFRPTP